MKSTTDYLLTLEVFIRYKCAENFVRVALVGVVTLKEGLKSSSYFCTGQTEVGLLTNCHTICMIELIYLPKKILVTMM